MISLKTAAAVAFWLSIGLIVFAVPLAVTSAIAEDYIGLSIYIINLGVGLACARSNYVVYYRL